MDGENEARLHPDPQATCGCDNDGKEYCPKCKKHKWPSDPAAKAREIAEHVADIIWELPGGVDIREKGVKLIAAALEAERKAGRKEFRYGVTIFYEYFDKHGRRIRLSEDALEIKRIGEAEGYLMGLEEAAKVVDVHGSVHPVDTCVSCELADRIRGLSE